MKHSVPLEGFKDGEGNPLLMPYYRIIEPSGPVIYFKIIDIKRIFGLMSVSDTKITSIVGHENIKIFDPVKMGEFGKPCRYIDEFSMFKVLVFYSATERKSKILNGYLSHVYKNLNGGFANHA